jgi:hypothetical protein
MDINDYKLLLDTARLGWQELQEAYVDIARQASLEVPGARALLAEARAQRDRAMLDFVKLTHEPESSNDASARHRSAADHEAASQGVVG